MATTVYVTKKLPAAEKIQTFCSFASNFLERARQLRAPFKCACNADQNKHYAKVMPISEIWLENLFVAVQYVQMVTFAIVISSTSCALIMFHKK